jgi:hypothetical protein
VVINIAGLNARTTTRREPIEEFQADFQRELLAREGVDQRFEQRGEPWRFDAAKSLSHWSQSFVPRGQAVPSCQVDPKTKQTIEDASDLTTI